MAADNEVHSWWNDRALPTRALRRPGPDPRGQPGSHDFLGRELVGHHWQEFVLPGSTEEVAVMLEILAQVGAAESRFRMPRPDGGLIEFDS